MRKEYLCLNMANTSSFSPFEASSNMALSCNAFGGLFSCVWLAADEVRVRVPGVILEVGHDVVAVPTPARAGFRVLACGGARVAQPERKRRGRRARRCHRRSQSGRMALALG